MTLETLVFTAFGGIAVSVLWDMIAALPERVKDVLKGLLAVIVSALFWCLIYGRIALVVMLAVLALLVVVRALIYVRERMA